MSDRRTYVLDTSVLLAAGSGALRVFAEHAVVLPLVVVSELEAMRDDPEHGWLARDVLRALEELRVSAAPSGSTLRDGVEIGTQGGTLSIELNHVSSRTPAAVQAAKPHVQRVLTVACALQEERPESEVVVVSRDLPMRLLAGGVLGLRAEDYRNDQAPDTGYTGIEEVAVDASMIDRLYDARTLPLPAELADLPTNTGLVLSAGQQSALACVRAPSSPEDLGRRQLALIREQTAFDLRPRSSEQRIALAHLLNDDIGIVSLGGRAGTGKSLLALASGLEAVMERDRQKRIVVFRPMYSVGGQDLGFLPGTEEEKMAPWAAAVSDALDVLCGDNVRDEIDARGLVEVLPLTHIRGRTLTDTWVIVDEAQNLERPVLLSALSRLGEGSKVVLCSDVAQRDNLHVGRHDGIASVVERLKGQPLFAHVTLTRSERSAVAELVTTLLDTF
ncbi:MAG TPA: PhoH family protein [Acidimicrobiales bacterium]|nr:PhoH family protein [Acidimicrobiales bacterium]